MFETLVKQIAIESPISSIEAASLVRHLLQYKTLEELAKIYEQQGIQKLWYLEYTLSFFPSTRIPIYSLAEL